MDNVGGRVIVGVDGSIGSLAALRRGVAEARLRDSVLVTILAWIPPGGEGIGRRTPCPPLLLAEWQREARRRLRAAWDEALGGFPRDLEIELRVERGWPGWVLTEFARRANDLLVVGAGRRTATWRLLARSVARYCVGRAECAVIVEPPPAMARLHGRARRRMVRDLTTVGLAIGHGSNR